MQRLLVKLRKDVAAYAAAERCEPNLGFWLRMLLFTPGFQLVLSIRVQEGLRAIPVIGRGVRLPVWWATCIVHRCEIAKAATIEGGLYIPHPYGIVIGQCIIGENVAIMQHVTVGTKHIQDRSIPVIGDRVVLGAGCAVLGSVSIGADCRVGANAVVLDDLPPNCVAVGVPARVVPATVVRETAGLGGTGQA